MKGWSLDVSHEWASEGYIGDGSAMYIFILGKKHKARKEILAKYLMRVCMYSNSECDTYLISLEYLKLNMYDEANAFIFPAIATSFSSYIQSPITQW